MQSAFFVNIKLFECVFHTFDRHIEKQTGCQSDMTYAKYMSCKTTLMLCSCCSEFRVFRNFGRNWTISSYILSTTKLKNFAQFRRKYIEIVVYNSVCTVQNEVNTFFCNYDTNTCKQNASLKLNEILSATTTTTAGPSQV